MFDASFFTDQQVHLQPDLPFQIEKARQMDQVPLHAHQFLEIAFVAGGSALHHHIGLDGKSRTGGLIQGDLFSVLPGEKHRYDACGSMVLYNIYLKPEWLVGNQNLAVLPGYPQLFAARESVPRKNIHLSPAVRTVAAQNLERSISECRLRQPGYRTIAVARFLEFLITAMRFESDHYELGENSFGVLKSISMMEEAPERHFTLETLAAASSMSVPSYTKKFRQATGVSPMEYLLNIRLLQVRHYLATTDLSIGEIAGRCGFCTPNYLIKIFRRQLGITPVQYRRELLEKGLK